MSVFFFLLVSGVWHAMFISYCEKVSVVSLSVNIAPQKKIRAAIYIYGRIRFTSDTRMSKTICPSLVLIYFAHLFLKSIGGSQKSIPQIHTPK